jgi:O-antigen/teichoic acid export membrane protein
MIKKLIKFSASYAAIEGLQKGILFLLTPVFTYYMSPVEYGIVATVLMIIPFLLIIFSLTLQASISRYYYKYQFKSEKLKDFLGTNFIFLTLVSFSFAIISFLFLKPLFLYLFPDINYNPYIIYALIIGATQPIMIAYFALLKAMKNLKKYIIIYNMYFSMQIILMLVSIVYFNMKQEGYILSLVITNFTFIVVVLYLLYDKVNFCLKKEYIKESLKYSLPIIPVDGIGLISSMIDRYYILKFIGLAGVGVYFVDYQISLIISLITRAINSAYMPIFFMKYEQNETDYRELYRIGEFIIYFSAIIALLLSVFSPVLIELLFDKSYTKAQDIVLYLSFSGAFTSIYFLNTNVLSLEAKLIKLKTIGIIAGAFISVILGFFMTKYYGLVGAATSTLIGFVITTLILIYIVNKKTNFNFHNLRSITFLLLMFTIGFVTIHINDMFYKVVFLVSCVVCIFFMYEKKLIVGVFNGSFNIKE